MNRLLIGLCLSLLLAPAWAQQGKAPCFSMLHMAPWIQVDAQTALVNVGRRSYLVTVPDCSSFFTGLSSEVVGSNGSRVCEGAEIRYSNGPVFVESCFVEDIVRVQTNPNTNAIEINEFDD